MGIKKINYSFLVFLFSIIILNTYIIFSITNTNNINKNIFRFHVVANSNSISDQIIKLKISSKLQTFFKSLNLNNKSTKEIYEILYNNSAKIIEIADSTLDEENAFYSSTLKLGKIYYDTSKDNALVHMENGTYNSIQILLR